MKMQTRFIVLSLLSCLPQTIVAELTRDELINVLGGNNDEFPILAQDIPADSLYGTFPECNACNSDAPCLQLNGDRRCETSSFYTDGSLRYFNEPVNVPYCQKNSHVCCVTSACQKPVSKCEFNANSLLDSLSSLIDVQSLQRLAMYSSEDLQEALKEEVATGAFSISDDCNNRCNSWVKGTLNGDLSPQDCPNLCKCALIDQGSVVSSGDFICRKTTENGSKIGYEFSEGNKEFANNIENVETVCEEGYECLDSRKCIEYDEFEKLEPNNRAFDDKNKSEKDSNSSSETEESNSGTLTAVLVIVGGVVLIAIIIVVAVRWNKRGETNQGGEPIVEDDPIGTTHYTEI